MDLSPKDQDTYILNDAERDFLEGVFTYQHIHRRPSLDEFRDALEVMSAYALQREDDPIGSSTIPDSAVFLWQTDRERLMTAAAAFMKFRATCPTAEQWRIATAQLFGSSPALSQCN